MTKKTRNEPSAEEAGATEYFSVWTPRLGRMEYNELFNATQVQHIPKDQLDKYSKEELYTLEEVKGLISDDDYLYWLSRTKKLPVLSMSAVVIPQGESPSGILVTSARAFWVQIVKKIVDDFALAFQIPPSRWEEILAAAFDEAGFDEVILTPRSGDHGRDVIATRRGVGCIKIINSMKAYKPGNIVRYDDVRALLGVMSGERDVSKGMITTTSDFPPNIMSDPFIAPFIPTRLELMNGEQLRLWLDALLKKRV